MIVKIEVAMTAMSKKKCSPFSLPFEGKQIPVCQTGKEKFCYEKVLRKLMSDLDKHCKSPCITKEFKIETHLDDSGIVGRNESAISVRFELPAATTRHMTKTPYKIVKKEQYVISGLALLGNVGGILGIFVGFSILGFSEWMIKASEELWTRFKLGKYF